MPCALNFLPQHGYSQWNHRVFWWMALYCFRENFRENLALEHPAFRIIGTCLKHWISHSIEFEGSVLWMDISYSGWPRKRLFCIRLYLAERSPDIQSCIVLWYIELLSLNEHFRVNDSLNSVGQVTKAFPKFAYKINDRKADRKD